LVLSLGLLAACGLEFEARGPAMVTLPCVVSLEFTASRVT
jgi:hypothetical protein